MNESQLHAWQVLGLGPRWLHLGSQQQQTSQPEPEHELLAPAASASLSQAHDIAVTAMPPVSDRASSGGESAVLGQRRSLAIAELDWDALRQEITACQACPLSESRKNPVFGAGVSQASWMVIGEAPGAEEDARGEAFVGQAGRLLDSMLASIGLSRDKNVFIANVLKCRPPNNRDPQPEEVACCEPFLARQIALLNPKIIVVMGRFAAQTLLSTEASIASLRGRVHGYAIGDHTIPVVVTYHPAYLLRSPVDKAKSWSDLCLARALESQAA